jgi:hypothetical protein
MLMCVVGTGFLAGCMGGPGTFGSDVSFLKKHTQTVVLSDAGGTSFVVIAPQLQGRVMTSSGNGRGGQSFGWINRELLAADKPIEHFNPYGGEDRFWIGPEGGQFSVFFAAGAAFDSEHWHTPAVVDTEPFDLINSSRNKALLTREFELKNYSGTAFKIRVERQIKLLERHEAIMALGVPTLPALNIVAFESDNTMINAGQEPWKKETGLLSIWILGMFNASEGKTAVIPFNAGPASESGPIVNDTYSGKVPADRLVVKDKAMFFSHDGKCRSKIGLSPRRAKSVLGSYDVMNKVLTIVQYNKPEGAADYVNSAWEMQANPFSGDVVNSCNDGPSAPGKKPLGPFCDLETSSPAAALAPGEKILHVHRTFHIQGPEIDLDTVSKAVLGVPLDEIKSALSPKT